jgi:hypothetical protein
MQTEARKIDADLARARLATLLWSLYKRTYEND